MNPWVMIGMALVILLTLFGRNPYQEAIEARKKDPRDPLIRAIDEHNQASTFGGGLFKKSGNGSTILPSTMPQPNGQNAQSQFPPYMRTPQLPTQAPTQSNSYYPPAPVDPNSNVRNNKRLVAPQGMKSLPPGYTLEPPTSPESMVHDAPAHLLASGGKVIFTGINVYMVADDGTVSPMPDGTYAMYDGSINIKVRDGHKI